MASLARLSSLARAAWDAGRRILCIQALAAFGDTVMRGAMDLGEPFWPATARFDCISPGGKRGEWVLASAFEQLVRARGHSSIFIMSGVDLDWLCAQPFVSNEMERRRILQCARGTERVEVPPRLCVTADDHLNADVWRAGLVPNTFVGEVGRMTV
jgi:hypothetical protein